MATSAHLKPTEGADVTRRVLIAVVAVLAAIGIAAVGIVTSRQAHGTTSAVGAGGSGTSGSAGAAGTTTTSTVPPAPLTVRSFSPPGATPAATGSVITVTFSAAPKATSPTPTISPTLAGRWVRSGTTETFHPSAGLLPDTTYTVHVPGRIAAVERGTTVKLGLAVNETFAVGAGSVRRLQELLAELRYLPVSFRYGSAALDAEPHLANRVSTAPAAGHFHWTSTTWPAALQTAWSPGQANLVTKGAVMAFEADHGLPVDGVAGTQVWGALRAAVAARQTDPRPYSYISVTEHLPETLSVWQDGKVVYTSLANTGVAGAETAIGTFTVFTHYVSTEMKGTNVNGTKYDDKDIPYAAYFEGGDAIHGYPRSSYGYPQSNGCVELPIANAGTVFNSGMDWYGTLVTVA